jgi:hypothetical protein
MWESFNLNHVSDRLSAHIYIYIYIRVQVSGWSELVGRPAPSGIFSPIHTRCHQPVRDVDATGSSHTTAPTSTVHLSFSRDFSSLVVFRCRYRLSRTHSYRNQPAFSGTLCVPWQLLDHHPRLRPSCWRRDRCSLPASVTNSFPGRAVNTNATNPPHRPLEAAR